MFQLLSRGQIVNLVSRYFGLSELSILISPLFLLSVTQDFYGPQERMTYPSDAEAKNRPVSDWRSQDSLRPKHPIDRAVECQRTNQTSSRGSAPERHHPAEPQRNCPLCPSVFHEPLAKERVLRHLAEFHFHHRIMSRAVVVGSGGAVACPECCRQFLKDTGFVLHYGLDHGAVGDWLREINVSGW